MLIHKKRNIFSLSVLLLTSSACASSILPLKECDKIKDLKIKALIVQKIQKVKGESIIESEIPLEKHYYPQMDRPKEIIISGPKEVIRLTFLSKDKKSQEMLASKKSKSRYHFSLPSFTKFEGRLLLQFKDNERCQSSLVFEELSP